MSPRKKIMPIVTMDKCINCEYCHTPHNKSLEGDYILGKCRKSEYSILLIGWCKDFKKRNVCMS